ncbi:hypothetical protein ACFOLJ_23495 [Rugamonas sp. CCM 8940]|uniref:hypothetical protein n=1 Tax=Rugamonas sp. CCM 8940 TaxID=2765359 RepID=UPI0018F38D3C|nr:hypothetical protein [Rugamonas sp. CCM 8940]MBJ7314385.1 hypothetical protein [Rugamonas sp. CCM 8940]
MGKNLIVLMFAGVMLSTTASAQSLITAEALQAGAGTADTVLVSNPGKEGLFFYDAADSLSAHNGGTVIVNSAGRRYKRLYSGALNAKWFGLKEGATVNNSAAINAALAVVKNNQELLIEAGDYYFGAPIVIGLYTSHPASSRSALIVSAATRTS